MAATAGESSAPALVSPEWLAERLEDPAIKVLDASWFMPNAGRNAVAEFKESRIPGSSFFDVDGISDPSAGLPHMLPTEASFSAAMDALGITADTHVVVYDRTGIFSAPRTWWTFNVFGHYKVSVMEGGLPIWKEKDLPLETTEVSDETIEAPTKAARSDPPPKASYVAKLDKSKVRSREQMIDNISSKAEAVVDARSAGRFKGTEPEPRAGMRGGHIPGSFSVPFPMVLTTGPSGACYKDPEALKKVFADAGVDLEQSKGLVGSCGSGMTACVLALAVFKATGKLIAIYDGSWMEWGGRPDTPIDTEAEEKKEAAEEEKPNKRIKTA